MSVLMVYPTSLKVQSIKFLSKHVLQHEKSYEVHNGIGWCHGYKSCYRARYLISEDLPEMMIDFAKFSGLTAIVFGKFLSESLCEPFVMSSVQSGHCATYNLPCTFE